MLKKRDWFLKFRKRAAALLLAMNMALGSVSGMVLEVRAASYAGQFEFDKIIGNNDATATVVAGAEIPINGRLPANYTIKQPFFNISRGDDNATIKKFFAVSDGKDNRKWTLRVDITAGDNKFFANKDGSPSPDDKEYYDSGADARAQYSLQGVLASAVEEEGVVSLNATDENNKPIGSNKAVIKADNVMGMTQNSGFSFSFNFEVIATKDDKTGKITGYDISKNGGWAFPSPDQKLVKPYGEIQAQFTGGTISGDYEANSNKDVLKVTINNPENTDVHSRTFTITGLNNLLTQCINTKMREVNQITGDEQPDGSLQYNYDKEFELFKIKVNFSASFEVPEGNPMLLTVYRPVEALKQIVRALESDRDTATDDEDKPFITLANGDSLIEEDVGISQKFKIQKNITRFNSRDFKIKWSWVPKVIETDGTKYKEIYDNYKDIIRFSTANSIAEVKPVKETVEGFLVARIFYTPKTDIRKAQTDAEEFKAEGEIDGAALEDDPEGQTLNATLLKQGDSEDKDGTEANAKWGSEFKQYRATAVIPVKVLGTGEPPEVKFEKQITGYYDKTEEKQADQEPKAVTYPLHMGTYDNGSNPRYFDQTELPYKYTGTIRFGTLGSKAEKLIITQTSVGGGEVELYTGPGQDEKYTFGTEIPNEEPENGHFIVPFTVKATRHGTTRLNFSFIGRSGNPIPNDGRGVYEFQIKIDDNSRDPRATLKKLEMIGVLDDNVSPMIKETFYKNFPGGVMDFGFAPETWEYGSITNPITLPASVERLSFGTEYTVERNKYPIEVSWVRDISTDSGVNSLEHPPGEIGPIPPDSDLDGLNTNSVYTIRFTCTAETGDTAIYTLYVKREEESNDAFLKSLSVYPERKSETPYTMEPEFKSDFFVYHEEPNRGDPTNPNKPPITTGDEENVYVVHVPYRQKDKIDIRAVANNAWASSIKIEKADELKKRATVSFLSRIAATINPEQKQEFVSEKNKPALKYDANNISAPDYNLTKFHITVTSENGEVTTTYELHVYVNDPSENDRMQEPKLSYWINGSTFKKDETDLPLVDGFDPEYPTVFTERVPYSTTRFKVVITPEDYLATKVTIGLPDNKNKDHDQAIKDHPELSKDHHDKDGVPQPIEFIIEDAQKYFDASNKLDLLVWIDPEYPGKIGKPYTITIEREEPNRDNTAEITLTNTTTNAQVTPDEGFDYNNIIDDYDVEIEYSTDNTQLLVQVVPTAPTTKVAIRIDGKGDFKEPRPDGTLAKLTPGATTKIEIRLTPEDTAFTRLVTINVKYLNPSKNCYLKDLKAGTLLFRPIPTPFDKKKLNYKIEIPKGMTTIPITAWLLDDGSKDDSSKATITINDKKVGNGEAYNFTPSEKTGKIKVVVTAQDGKTKRTYTISYKNWNMLKPNDEDMLKDLWVDYADMQPKFDSSITEYEVYLKPEAMDIKVYPKLRDSSCKVEVTAESKVLTEFEDYYSTSLMDDEMDIHVYVWSEQAIVNNMSNNTTAGGDTTVLPDKEENPPRTTAREYILHLYRNDDEKIGNFKPLPAEDVDFVSSDPIVIDITQYPIISADVFKTLKEDYPDKSIIFKGNDYTLQIFGADIDGIIPNIESFDLRFSFRTPDEKKIRDAMDAAGNNSHIEPVYYYFNQHGALPGEMLLTVDLGRHYSNETLFWNYYNQERDRIDYYGYVHTNAKGTFSVPISHFSTYLSTDERIRGAENKSDEYGNPIPLTEETENLNSAGSANKDIPNTAAPISFTVPTLNQTSAAQQPVHHSSSSAGSAAVRATTPTIDIALPERKKISPVRKKSTGMPTGILK